MDVGSRESHPDRHRHISLPSDGDGGRAALLGREQRPYREPAEPVVAGQHATARGIGPIGDEQLSCVPDAHTVVPGIPQSALRLASANRNRDRLPEADCDLGSDGGPHRQSDPNP